MRRGASAHNNTTTSGAAIPHHPTPYSRERLSSTLHARHAASILSSAVQHGGAQPFCPRRTKAPAPPPMSRRKHTITTATSVHSIRSEILVTGSTGGRGRGRDEDEDVAEQRAAAQPLASPTNYRVIFQSFCFLRSFFPFSSLPGPDVFPASMVS